MHAREGEVSLGFHCEFKDSSHLKGKPCPKLLSAVASPLNHPGMSYPMNSSL